MANIYDNELKDINEIILPKRSKNSSHVFHQYTIRVKSNRDAFRNYLASNNIPSMVYYPIPLYRQEAFSSYVNDKFSIKNVEDLCESVLSLPIHTEIKNSSQDYIINTIKNFYN